MFTKVKTKTKTKAKTRKLPATSAFHQFRGSRKYVNSFGRNSRNTWYELPDKIRKKYRDMIEQRDGLVCNKRDGCGQQYKSTDLTVDHIIPIRAGGPVADISNMQFLCVQCHENKTFSKDIEYSNSFRVFWRAKARVGTGRRRLYMR